MPRFLSLFIILGSTILLAMAATPKKLVNHGRDFMFNRPIVVDSDNAMAKEQVAKLISDAGGNLKKAIIFNKKIVINKVRNIDGVTEANSFQIHIAPRKATIHYTSEASMAAALLKFGELVDNGRIIGRDITDWSSTFIAKNGVINCSSKLLTVAEIESTIKNSRTRQVILMLADNTNWRMQTDVFQLANPTESIYAKDGFYSHEMIAAIISKASHNRVTVVPMVELLTPNTAFERVTGHSQFSVEGMRFVRAIVEELVRELNCKAICLGTKSESADARYMQFIEEITANCNVELIIN